MPLAALADGANSKATAERARQIYGALAVTGLGGSLVLYGTSRRSL